MIIYVNNEKDFNYMKSFDKSHLLPKKFRTQCLIIFENNIIVELNWYTSYTNIEKLSKRYNINYITVKQYIRECKLKIILK